MNRRLVGPLALACLLVLAGCANPFGPGDTPTPSTPAVPPISEESPTPDTTATTAGASPGDTSPTPTTTPTTPTGLPANETFPPGVSADGIDNESVLFRAHARTLGTTGFVAVGNGSSVVSRSGILVEVETTQRNRVAANGSPYEISREVAAGPIQRSLHAWSNGSIEYVRTQENGETNYSTAERRRLAGLAGNGLIAPYVRGGNFTVRDVRNESGGPTVVVLNTTEVANETVLERAVTDDAEEITGYEALVAIDAEGRIRLLDAAIEYTIDGQTATQEFTYTLTSIENVEVERPEWVDEARDAGNESQRAGPVVPVGDR